MRDLKKTKKGLKQNREKRKRGKEKQKQNRRKKFKADHAKGPVSVDRLIAHRLGIKTNPLRVYWYY